MLNKKTAVGLSLAGCIIAVIYACQADNVKDGRTTATGQTSQPATKTGDSNTADKNAGTTTPGTTPTTNTGGTTPAAPLANYTMTWDASADAAVVSYKIFVVPPDQNSRFPGKTDVPIQIKNYPIAGLQKNGTKYSVVVTGAEVKTALGTLNVTAPCFTIVAVNGVGNSSHSPVICP